jgi:hypothetical protein
MIKKNAMPIHCGKGRGTMENREAILGYAQSDKVKSGLIWVTQMAEIAIGLKDGERLGGEKIVQTTIALIANEAHLAKTITRDQRWEEIEKNIEKARVMIHSGVLAEVTYHLTQALSQVTSIGQQTMTFLLDRKLI